MNISRYYRPIQFGVALGLGVGSGLALYSNASEAWGQINQTAQALTMAASGTGSSSAILVMGVRIGYDPSSQTYHYGYQNKEEFVLGGKTYSWGSAPTTDTGKTFGYYDDWG